MGTIYWPAAYAVYSLYAMTQSRRGKHGGGKYVRVITEANQTGPAPEAVRWDLSTEASYQTFLSIASGLLCSYLRAYEHILSNNRERLSIQPGRVTHGKSARVGGKRSGVRATCVPGLGLDCTYRAPSRGAAMVRPGYAEFRS